MIKARDEIQIFYVEIPYGKSFFVLTESYLLGLAKELVAWRLVSNAYPPSGVYEIDENGKKFRRVSKKEIIEVLNRDGLVKEAKFYQEKF